MAVLIEDRVQETATTINLLDFVLLGAVVGFVSFASRFADADQVYYVAVAVDANGVPTGQWEDGIGTVATGGTVLQRTTPTRGSSGDNTKVSFGAGTKRIFVDTPSWAAGGGNPFDQDLNTFDSPFFTGLAVAGVQATVDTDLGTANANIRFTSRQPGTQANALTITYVDPGLPDQVLALVIDYPNLDPPSITVNLATDGGGAITTTANDIIVAFTTADGGFAKAVHTIAVAAGGDGTGLVAAGTWTLAGGANGILEGGFGLNLSGSAFGSYAGRPTACLLRTDDSNAWVLWSGQDNGFGWIIQGNDVYFARGLGDGTDMRIITSYGDGGTLIGAEGQASMYANASAGIVEVSAAVAFQVNDTNIEFRMPGSPTAVRRLRMQSRVTVNQNGNPLHVEAGSPTASGFGSGANLYLDAGEITGSGVGDPGEVIANATVVAPVHAGASATVVNTSGADTVIGGGASIGTAKSGDVVLAVTPTGATDNVVTGEVLSGSGGLANVTLFFQLAEVVHGVVPGSISITSNNGQTITDDGANALIGNVGSGPNVCDYDTGEVVFSFASNYTAPVSAAYRNLRRNAVTEAVRVAAADSAVTLVGTLKAANYKSGDGSLGIDTTITTGSLVGKTITVKDGLITGFA